MFIFFWADRNPKECRCVPQKELKEIERDRTSGVTVQITGNNLQRLTGFVEGWFPSQRSLSVLVDCRLSLMLVTPSASHCKPVLFIPMAQGNKEDRTFYMLPSQDPGTHHMRVVTSLLIFS